MRNAKAIQADMLAEVEILKGAARRLRTLQREGKRLPGFQRVEAHYEAGKDECASSLDWEVAVDAGLVAEDIEKAVVELEKGAKRTVEDVRKSDAETRARRRASRAADRKRKAKAARIQRAVDEVGRRIARLHATIEKIYAPRRVAA